jgi:hypothetical protein
MKGSNDKPPYRHWHTVCAAWGKITLALPCKMPGDIEPHRAQSRSQMPALLRHAAIPRQGLLPRSALCSGII